MYTSIWCVCVYPVFTWGPQAWDQDTSNPSNGNFMNQALGREVAQGPWQEPLICSFLPGAGIKWSCFPFLHNEKKCTDFPHFWLFTLEACFEIIGTQIICFTAPTYFMGHFSLGGPETSPFCRLVLPCMDNSLQKASSAALVTHFQLFSCLLTNLFKKVPWVSVMCGQHPGGGDGLWLRGTSTSLLVKPSLWDWHVSIEEAFFPFSLGSRKEIQGERKKRRKREREGQRFEAPG